MNARRHYAIKNGKRYIEAREAAEAAYNQKKEDTMILFDGYARRDQTQSIFSLRFIGTEMARRGEVARNHYINCYANGLIEYAAENVGFSL